MKYYIGDICQGKVLKSTDQLKPELVAANVTARKAKRDGEGPSKEEAQILKAIARRKNSPSKLVEMIKAKRANPTISFTELGRMYDMPQNQARDACVGNTKLYEQEFPIDGVTWEEYKGWFK